MAILVVICIYFLINFCAAIFVSVQLGSFGVRGNVIVKAFIYSLMLGLLDYVVNRFTGKTIDEHVNGWIEKIRG